MAKQISYVAGQKFLSGKKFKQGNTEVKIEPTMNILKLFDNEIAYMDNLEKSLSITNCGHFTDTTKERLNALPGVYIQVKQFQWYLNGKEWDGELTKI